MKRLLAVITLLAALVGAAQDFAKSEIADLALIYQGGIHRIDWNEDEITPYVVHRFADGSRQWLFDGFLFLEFKDACGHQFSPGYDSINARRSHWEWYMDRLFECGKALDALDAAISRTRAKIGDPPFRHKVVLTLFVPINGQTDWGEIDGEAMDFNNRAYQLRAIKWMADTLESRFADAGYENLDLHGFYWIDEDYNHARDYLPEIAPFIHEKGLKFVWIPYYNAAGHQDWAKMGFDIAYQQPNHFFDAKIPNSRLDDAIAEALRCGMAMEFECDERALSQSPEQFAPRMEAYIDAFERHGVFDRSAIAYYTGNHLLTDFATMPSRQNTLLADRLARLIVARKNT